MSEKTFHKVFFALVKIIWISYILHLYVTPYALQCEVVANPGSRKRSAEHICVDYSFGGKTGY